jgi:hypothetical protein
MEGKVMNGIIRSTKVRLAAVFTTGALAVGLIAAPGASAQQTGLVNIDLDVSHNNVAVVVPINAAANICGVDVEVLTADLLDNNQATCTADADQTVELVQRQ